MSAATSSLLLIAAAAFAQDSIAPSRLLTENRVDPIGIDATAPRLSWNLNWPGAMQQPIRCGPHRAPHCSNTDSPTCGTAGEWNPLRPRVSSTEARLCDPRDRVVWQVRVWTTADVAAPSAWSDPASWEMGLLNPLDWQAQWIAHPAWNFGQPLPIFAKQFAVSQGVKRARLYITGLGNYVATINGAAVTDEVLAPGNTDYSKQVEYAVYDVTALLTQGANTISVELGNGIYNSVQTPGRYFGILVPAPSPVKLIAQLEIVYEDGSAAVFASGADWRHDAGANYLVIVVWRRRLRRAPSARPRSFPPGPTP